MNSLLLLSMLNYYFGHLVSTSHTLGSPEKGCLLLRIASLGTLSSDSSSQLHILWHNSDSFSVNSAQVGIFEQSNQVSFRCFLESHYSRGLESEIGLEILGNFTDQSLEGQFSEQKLSRLLVTSDLTKSNSSWSESVCLLDTSSSWGRFAGGLGGKLFSWGFASS